jgi:hypothetical protein
VTPEEIMKLADEWALRFHGAAKYGGTAEPERARLESAIRALAEQAEKAHGIGGAGR